MKKTVGYVVFLFILLNSVYGKEFVRNDIENIVIDNKNKLMWQDNKEAKTNEKNWKDANRYCNNLLLSGFNDWRLPSIKELETIVDSDRADPSICTIFKNISADSYWTSTSLPENKNNARLICFVSGDDNDDEKVVNYCVRCVRDL
ncbi:MAG: DUF1566 domain-containing protein [Arcobacteraceae bacterium]|nr:DUF1566 domain-containing protein [Arcobacteraceae bacterium]